MLKSIFMYLRLILASPLKKATIYSKYLGIKFGENVRILYFPRFGSEPYLIEIGNNVTITRGVCFVNHDGGVALFRDKYPGLNVFGKITIGDNVFIGLNTIILPGVTIGSNVVIGAGSLINKDIPNDVVVAGVPGKVIKSLDQYREDSMKKAVIIIDKDPKSRKQKILEQYYQ